MSVAPEEPAVHDVGPIFAGRKTFRFEYKGSTLRIFDQMGFFVFVAKRKYGLPRHSFTLFYAPTRERVAKLKAKVSVRRHAWNLYICGTKYAKLRQLSNGKTVRFEIELISHARENISIYGSWTSNGWVIHRGHQSLASFARKCLMFWESCCFDDLVTVLLSAMAITALRFEKMKV
jgi:hypothetical protein